MKSINWMAPTTCHIFTGCVFLFHIINLVAAQAVNNIEPHDNNELATGVSRDTRALKLTTESSNNDDDAAAACPHCNILSEVRVVVNQLVFHTNFAHSEL